jgi:hypothetical protein
MLRRTQQKVTTLVRWEENLDLAAILESINVLYLQQYANRRQDFAGIPQQWETKFDVRLSLRLYTKCQRYPHYPHAQQSKQHHPDPTEAHNNAGLPRCLFLGGSIADIRPESHHCI